MNLTEIFSTLPLAVGNLLEMNLEAIQISKEPTREEVSQKASFAVEETKRELSDRLEEGGDITEVCRILDYVPEAAVQHLFD